MLSRTFLPFSASLCGAFALVFLTARADAGEWVVSKASGQAWIASARAQPASLGAETTLRPGDRVQTGPNGRVLLVRGEETILIAPNSVISLPNDAGPTGTTTILQQAGSIVVRAEKRGHKHFEVQTPYLAAVVKGTEFEISIAPSTADVHVTSGEVEVADFKSGQIALVLPGQAARASSKGDAGLMLRGSGVFNPIQQGAPVKPGLQRINVPKGGLGVPAAKPNQAVRGVSNGTDGVSSGHGRINAPIGDAKLDVHKATDGLARANVEPSSRSHGSEHSDKGATFWSADPPGGGNGNAYAFGSGNGNGNGNNNGNGNGNGSGNGKGKRKGKS